MAHPAVDFRNDAPLANARTLLFAPGNRPDRFRKALASGADGVVLDLEDSVPPSDKPLARQEIAAAWSELLAAGVPVVVRINSVDTDAGRTDLAWMARLPAPAGVMVPKVESASRLHDVSRALPGLAILPLVESAAGLFALPEIARVARVLRLIVGHLDFMADTGIRCSDDERELDTLRFQIALHTRLSGLAAPVDGVTAEIDDPARVQADTCRALRFGFAGKLCIHPRQVPAVHAAMQPTEAELDWARLVVASDRASGGAALRLGGRMIDQPVVRQALRTLAMARVVPTACT